MAKYRRSVAYSRLLNTQRWRKLRSEYLSANPLCEDCLIRDLSRPAQCVHHIHPIERASGNDALMAQLAYDWSNLRALCNPCHSAAHKLLGSQGASEAKARAEAQLNGFAQRYLAPSVSDHSANIGE